MHCPTPYQWSIISTLSFIQIVQDNLTQVFIKPIGFTLLFITKDIIMKHCCGLVFFYKTLNKMSKKTVRIITILYLLNYTLEVMLHYF